MYNLNKFFEEVNNVLLTDKVYLGFPVDLAETKEGYVIMAELPGILKENISITYEDNELSIEASRDEKLDARYLLQERRKFNFYRTFYFEDIDEESIKAKFENGLLIISINKKIEEKPVKKNIIIE